MRPPSGTGSISTWPTFPRASTCLSTSRSTSTTWLSCSSSAMSSAAPAIHGKSRRPDTRRSVSPVCGIAQGMEVSMLRQAQGLAFVMALLGSVIPGAPALGAECLAVKVPDSVKTGGADLVLNGLGIRKATFLEVKVYVAALYL